MKNYLTIAQAAERLGYSPGAVRNLIRQGRLPVVRLSERVKLIPRAAVDGYAPKASGWPKKVEKTSKIVPETP